jgi:hypothetical protein
MIDPTFILEIVAMSFLFLLASIWSEDNVRFGYVLVPFMAGFFWWAGFLPFAYLTTVIPLMVFMGIISYLRSQLKYKWGVFGGGGGILYKLVFFLIMIQLAIGYVNGLGVFAGNAAITPANEYTTYNLSSANSSFGVNSYGMNAADAVSNGFMLAWSMFGVLWSMIAAVFLIYPLLVSVFHIPPDLSLLIQAGIYILYALELVNLLYKPSRLVEV